MKLLFQSVRWRLLLWYALILMCLIAGLCLLAYKLTSNDRTFQIDREIRDRLRNPGEVSAFPPELHALFEGGNGGIYLGFWDSDGSPLFISANAPDKLCRGIRDVWLRGQDLNLRPLGYEPNELPGCSTPRLKLRTIA